MALTEVLRTDTFEQWRTKTNTISSDLGDRATLSANITANTSLVGAINELQTDIGVIGSLSTFAASNIVAALNELKTGSASLTNKTIALGSNTISGTLAEFNTALTDDNFVAASSVTFIGTTSVSLSRGSGNLALTGISSISLPGSTSGTVLLQSTAIAGTNTITLPATSGTLITSGDSGTVTNTMLAGSIANAKLAGNIENSKLANSSVTLGSTAVALGATASTLTSLSLVTPNVVTSLGDNSIVFAVVNNNSTYTDSFPSAQRGANRVTVTTAGTVEIKGDLIVRGGTTITGTADISANFNTLINKPSPVIAVSMTGDVTASGSITLTELTAGTYTINLASTIAANSVALGTDTTGDYVSTITGNATEIVVTSGTGETSTAALSIGSAVARRADTHFIGTTSIALNRATGAQTLTGVSIDGNAGTVTNGVVTTGSYANPTWITSLAGSKVTGTITVSGSSGLSAGGSASIGGTISLTNTDRGSSQNIFKNIIVSGQTTVVADNNDDSLTLASDGSISITTNATTDTISLAHADTSSVSNVSSDNSAGVVLQDISFGFDTYGHVTSASVGTVNLDSRYIQSNQNVTLGNLTVSDLTVNGTTTVVNSTTVEIVDLNILLAKNSTTAAQANGAGLTIGSYASNPTLLYTSSSDRWVFNRGVEGSSIVRTGGTSGQFLKADGSVDSNTYLTTAVTSATASTGINVSSSTGSVTFTNTGVTSITGTANQVTASASTGGVTLSLPQSINTTAGVQFGSIGVGTAASGVTGEIRAIDNVTAYYSSDGRLKTNVRKIENALDKVTQINGVVYDWNDTYKKSHGDIDGYFVRNDNSGVIAQDVEKVFPNVVAERPDGFKAVRYELLVPLLIEAIKDLKAEIELLKANK